jgi:hypothetical protein
MDKIRAEIVDTGIELFYKTQLEIKAPAKVIFDLIADPKNHQKIDGSGMLQGELRAPERLYLGAKFGMKMKIIIPYLIKNEVVEFEENKSLAWRHLMHNVWRYELIEIDPRTTRVIQTWDGRKARSKRWVSQSYKWVPRAMAKTLVRLKDMAEKQVS